MVMRFDQTPKILSNLTLLINKAVLLILEIKDVSKEKKLFFNLDESIRSPSRWPFVRELL
jgi:hypothetical protein